MPKFEQDYAALIARILLTGEERETRNGMTKSKFGMNLSVPIGRTGFPLLRGRKTWYKGVLGEYAAMIRKPTSVEDFKRWGCNYWELWAQPNGDLNVDYGNAWFDFNGVDQIAELKDKLANNPMDRRMIVSGWRPERLSSLDLPCCHYSYQFYVREGKYLDMLWTQRSVDMMIGLPSDIIFAAVWLISLAREFGLTPGTVHMSLGDCHVYGNHIDAAEQYLDSVGDAAEGSTYYDYTAPVGFDSCAFEPDMLKLSNVPDAPKLHLELNA